MDTVEIIGRTFPNSRVLKQEQLDGQVNANMKVTLDTQVVVVRKYNEGWKAIKEQALYMLLRSHGIPVPQVFACEQGYTVLEYLEGVPLGNDSELARQAGEILARMHQISFPAFGWVTAGSVEKSYETWREFLRSDGIEKIQRARAVIPHAKEVGELLVKMLPAVPEGKPVLLHKDYHSSHIICRDRVVGIIDIEWAIAGRPGLDVVKPKWWVFETYPELEEPFMRGYEQVQPLVVTTEEMQTYELYTAISLVSFSVEQGHWLEKNKARLQKVVQQAKIL